MTVVHANLDCEARWAHANAQLPRPVLERVSLAGVLAAALAPGGPPTADVWTPAPVDRARLADFAVGALRVGTPPRADVHWAAPDARAHNDRRLLHTVPALAALALPGSGIATTLAEIDAIAAAAFVASRGDDLETSVLAAAAFVAKAPFTAAGRDRVIHRGPGPLAGEMRGRAQNLLARHGALVVEPWCDRIADFGQCGSIDDAARSAGSATPALAPAVGIAKAATVTPLPPHVLRVDARGGFLGISRDPAAVDAALLPGERAALAAALATAGAALVARGYRGPFAIDAFAHVAADGARRFHPLCEINARHTFGHVAHALAARELGFTPTPPPNARVLLTGAAWML